MPFWGIAYISLHHYVVLMCNCVSLGHAGKHIVPSINLQFMLWYRLFKDMCSRRVVRAGDLQPTCFQGLWIAITAAKHRFSSTNSATSDSNNSNNDKGSACKGSDIVNVSNKIAGSSIGQSSNHNTVLRRYELAAALADDKQK